MFLPLSVSSGGFCRGSPPLPCLGLRCVGFWCCLPCCNVLASCILFCSISCSIFVCFLIVFHHDNERRGSPPYVLLNFCVVCLCALFVLAVFPCRISGSFFVFGYHRFLMVNESQPRPHSQQRFPQGLPVRMLGLDRSSVLRCFSGWLLFTF